MFQPKGKYKLDPPKFYELKEEILNGITHGIGAALSIAGLTLLVVLSVLFGDFWQIISFTIYGSTLVIAYLASTLYHSFQHPPTKQVFRIIDQMAIYLLIAGTYTPFLLVRMRGPWGWSLLIIIWGLALLGIALKFFFFDRFERFSVLFYVAMGWLSVVALNQMLIHIPFGGMVLMALGGVIYTVGVIFYSWQRFPYNHAIWHVFVLGGSLCHFLAIFIYLTPIS